MKLVVSPVDSTITAGEYGRYILRTYDENDNLAAPAADQTITLIAGGGSFYDKDDHGTVVTQLVIPSGSSSVEVDFRHVVSNTSSGYFLVFLDSDGVAPLLQSDNTIVYVDHAAADISTSTIVTDKATATADNIDEIDVTVTVRDQFGNAVPGAAVVLSMTGPGNIIIQPAGVTVADGTAAGSVRSTVAEGKDIQATADAVLLDDIIGVTFTAGLVDLTVSTIGVAPDTVVANASDITTVTVTAFDQYGNPVQGATVVLASTGSGNIITQPVAVTDMFGAATGTIASTTAESKTVSATIGAQGLTPTSVVVFRTGNFSLDLSEIAADKADLTADDAELLTVTVTVRDGEGNPVEGSSVTLDATGEKTITQPAAVTGADGIATGTIRSSVAETKTVSARIEGSLINDTLDIDWTPGPVDLAVSTIDVAPDTVIANGSDETIVTVTALDQFGNAVPGAAVVLASTGSDNTITQPAVVTDGAGIATGTIASTTAESKTVSATIDGLGLTPTSVVVFRTGNFSLDLSEIAGDKTEVTANNIEFLAVTVTVRDDQGNPVEGASVALDATGFGNTYEQPVGVTGTNGIATGLVRSTVAEPKIVNARVDGFLIDDTLDIDWIPGPADMAVSTISLAPDTVVANGSDYTDVIVTALDVQGNPVPGAVVLLYATGTVNTIVQPVGVTGANGIANGTIASTTAELKTVSATINTFNLLPTADVVFRTGNFSPLLSEIAGDKTVVTADGTDLLTVTVTVRDDQGNPVEGSSVVLQASGPGNTYVQPVGVTGTNGIATGTIASTVAELKTVSGRVDGLLIDDTLEIDWVPGPVDLAVSTIVSDTDTVTADGSDVCRITVTVMDADGNPVNGSVVLLDATDTGLTNTIFQPSATDENGVAVGWINSTRAEVKTVTATIDAGTMNDDVLVAFIADVPDRFVFVHDGSGTAGVLENVTLEILDANDNMVDWFDDVIRIYTDSPEIADMIFWGLGGGSGSIVGASGDTVSYDFSPADNGNVTLTFEDRKAETVRFAASFGSVIDQSAGTMTIDPASADNIFVMAGDGQRAVVGQAVPQQLTVGVEDAFGNRVPGEEVTFAILSGSGIIDTDISTGGNQATVDTDGAGIAVCESWILGTVSGLDSDEATASIVSGTTSQVLFTATTDHDELDSVVLTPLSSDVTVNSATIVTATMTDQYNNLVVGENLTIYISDAADGTLEEDFSNLNPTLTLGPGIRSGTSDSTGTITVEYNSPVFAELADVIDADHAIVTADLIDDVTYTTIASGATKLIVTDITGQPSQAGVFFSFTVKAVDSNDNLDPTNTNHIVLAPQAGGGLTFSTTPGFLTTVTEADLAAGEIVLYGMGTRTGDWNIDITTVGLSATVFPAAITANENVHHYAITVPPSATAGVDFPVSLEAKDLWNNLVTTANYDIDLRAVQPVDTTLSAGSVITVLSGTISGGLFAEENIRYYVAEPIRVEISDDSTSVVGVSGIVDVGHAPAYQIVEISGDTTGVAAGDSILMSMRVRDQFSNPVVGETVSFSILEGGGGLAAPQRITGSDGTTSVSYATGLVSGTNRVRASILDGNPEGLETR